MAARLPAAEWELTIRITGDRELRRLNRQFLNEDHPTDVLSFPLSERGVSRLAGELVIGAEVAQTQAAVHGHELEAELALYVIHGLLHLCGYDDRNDAGAAEMRQREKHYLQQLGLPDIAPN